MSLFEAEAERVADDLYERYKNALRTGHVAVLRGRFPEALTAYREAAAIAPDRALPHTSLGGVLLRLGRIDEALAEYDGALARAPHDEGALLGRAEALQVAGRGADAAGSLDGVALIQEESGRLPEAADTLRRAIELDASPERVARREALVSRLQASSPEAGEDALGRALRPLEPGEGDSGPTEAASGPAPAESGTSEAGALAADEPVDGGAGAGVIALAESAPEPSSEGERQPASEAESTPSGDDLGDLERRAEEALDAGRADEATTALVALARRRGDAGLLDAALDAAHLALALTPGDGQLHLALVELYLTRGWHDVAAEKLRLLGRLAGLAGDSATTAEVARVAEASFAGNPVVSEPPSWETTPAI